MINHSHSSNLIPGEHTNGAAQSTKIEEDDYDPYADNLDPGPEEKPSTTAPPVVSHGREDSPLTEEEEDMQEDEEEGEDDDDDDDDGLDIVVTAPQRSMDFR